MIKPATLKAANIWIREKHRHATHVRGCLFCVRLEIEGRNVGFAVLTRPRARALDDGSTCEVARVVTDGTRNACSALYGALLRAATALGYERAVTYTLATEPGSSPRAAGFRLAATVRPDTWDRPNRKRATGLVAARNRWEKTLQPRR